MVNVLTFAKDIVTEFLPTLANLFSEVFTLTIGDLLHGLGTPDIVIALFELFGVLPETPLLGFLIGTGLYVVLTYNIVKWLVGVITGS